MTLQIDVTIFYPISGRKRKPSVNEDWMWIMAVKWFYLLLKPLLLVLADHVVFTCFQV